VALLDQGAKLRPGVEGMAERNLRLHGRLRPLGISTLRDRVCMTAAMLVLEPIFEADLPSEL
jgi:hypothetical protein